MQLTFLEAEVPLTKSYEKKQDGSYKGGGYPGVTNFTSHVEEVDSIARFATALESHATTGHCLLTNSLTEQITNASRRRLSDKDELRRWIVLDIDGVEGVTSIKEFVDKMLPVAFHNVSYVVQHSPSSGIKHGVRAHLFFMLEDEVDVKSISSWLKYTNLATELLSDQITLSKNSMALSLKLDWVANNNGRIIYITSPKCIGFSDLVTERIKCVVQKYDTLSFNFSAIGAAQMRAKYRAKLTELRADAGLSVSKKQEFFRILDDGKEAVLDELVEPGRITSWEADNDLFMRCNIDGGDSFGYYYHRNNAHYLHNFKGEPAVRLSLFDPEFFKNVAEPDLVTWKAKDIQPFVFYDRMVDRKYMGLRKGDEIIAQPMAVGAKDSLEDYFLFNNGMVPSPIPPYEKIFDPTVDEQLPEGETLVFNTWRPSKYMKDSFTRSTKPTIIDRIIRHVTGDDQETYDYFMNWIAWIYQKRTKTCTAWVLHGVPGTGKGLLYNNVLAPIFGRDYVAQKQIGDVAEKFNAWMERCLILNIDETNFADTGRGESKVVGKVKNWITEPETSIREMGVTAFSRPSYTNFIFTTNDLAMLPIQEGDRRFNVAPRQEHPLAITEEEVDLISTELLHFAQYLNNYEVDYLKAHRTLESLAKTDLHEATLSSIDGFFRAAREGDLQYFIDGLQEDSEQYSSIPKFKEAVEEWVKDLKAGRESAVTEQQLKHAHIVMCRDRSMKLNAFMSMCRKRGFAPARRRQDEHRWRGWSIEWQMSQEELRDLKAHLTVVPKTQEQLTEEIKSDL